ncbi:MAG: PPOX class F420-dependent oxidoreductase [Anaerolineaceae bacterium]
MSVEIPPEFLDLFQKKAFGHLATLMPDGTPQISPVWVDYDGRFLLVNSVKGRQKDRNIRRDGHVALEIQDPDNPYRYMLVRGLVIEVTMKGAEEHIDKLSLHYRGIPYPFKDPNQPRVIYKIEPLAVTISKR